MKKTQDFNDSLLKYRPNISLLTSFRKIYLNYSHLKNPIFSWICDVFTVGGKKNLIGNLFGSAIFFPKFKIQVTFEAS